MLWRILADFDEFQFRMSAIDAGRCQGAECNTYVHAYFHASGHGQAWALAKTLDMPHDSDSAEFTSHQSDSQKQMTHDGRKTLETCIERPRYWVGLLQTEKRRNEEEKTT